MAYNTNVVLENQADGYVAELKDIKTPMTDVGDFIIGGTNGAPTRFPKGVKGQVLKMDTVNGVLRPTWESVLGGNEEVNSAFISSLGSGLFQVYVRINDEDPAIPIYKFYSAGTIHIQEGVVGVYDSDAYTPVFYNDSNRKFRVAYKFRNGVKSITLQENVANGWTDITPIGDIWFNEIG